MKLEEIIKLENRILELGLDESMANREITEKVNETKHYFNQVGADAKARIEEKVGEENFVAFLSFLENSIMAQLMMTGLGQELLLDKMHNHDLQKYTHTIVLTVLGMAVDLNQDFL